MIEGKFTEDEAIAQSCDLLAAGVDTVRLDSNKGQCHTCLCYLE